MDDSNQEIVISIIIANYNASDLLKDCLESIYKNSPQVRFDIYVIDDASKDGSYEMVAREFPQVQLFRNEKNVNYALSNNRMIEKVSGKYIYLLNNDTLMLPETMDKMADFLDRNQQAGAVGSKLLNEDGSVQASVKTLPSFMSGMFGARSFIAKWFPNNPLTRRELLHLDRDMGQPYTAGYVSSASIMIRRDVMDKVGPLDPRMNYHVDADHCARIRKAGWEIYYLPDAVAIHLDHKGGDIGQPQKKIQGHH